MTIVADQTPARHNGSGFSCVAMADHPGARLSLAMLALAVASVDRAHAAPRPVPDLCNANQFVRFVGKPVAEIEEMHPPYARFLCKENCVGTADVEPSRLTVIYSKKSGRVIEVRCE